MLFRELRMRGHDFHTSLEGERKAVMRSAIAYAQRGICPICGEPLPAAWRVTLKLGAFWHFDATMDHVMPRSLGGFDGLGNLLVTHRYCNVSKGARPPNGCEIMMLGVTCERLGITMLLKPNLPWRPPPLRINKIS